MCPRFSFKGNRLAFGTRAGYRVVELNDGRTFSIDTVPDWGHGIWWSWSPDGREIWFTNGRTQSMRPIEAVSLAGRRRLLARVPGTMTLYDVSRDGLVLLEHGLSRVRAFARALVDNQERELSVFDGTRVTDLSADGALALLYERGSATDQRQFVYLRLTDGSPPMRLAEEAVPLALSPDGRWVLIAAATFTFETPRWSGVRVVPTGAGEAREVVLAGLEDADGCASRTANTSWSSLVRVIRVAAGAPSSSRRWAARGGRSPPKGCNRPAPATAFVSRASDRPGDSQSIRWTAPHPARSPVRGRRCCPSVSLRTEPPFSPSLVS